MNVLFGDDLDKIKDFHDIKCSDGGQGGDGLRNAKFDCGNVAQDAFLQRYKGQAKFRDFIARLPISADMVGLKACLLDHQR